ncbi:MAG TPA: PhzF family phenazine biosynthesis protein [Hyphomonadaceae bacterium]|nr:PhzF family phenazine biosynthesis protein [Hyphomonadaceae bacterium]HPN06318.1 PhzF family phenazine biosynthesis protein [Hyphomonadaceae bacterium]
MSEHQFFQIDAFAEKAMAGGPAAVMPMDAFPAAEVMQSIAAENNLAETAFIVAKGNGVFDLRWFTPALEVPLCGHATLASAHALYAHLGFDGPEIGFDTKSGRLTVKRLADGRLEMDFPARPPRVTPILEDLVEAIGARPQELTAGPFLMAVFVSPDEIIALKPDLLKVNQIAGEATGGRGNLVCAAPGANWNGGKFDVVSRFFAPGSGIPEDPATGSAHCIIAPFFSDRLGKSELNCFQAYPGRGAHITTRMAGDRVKLIGRARTVIEGVFRL